MSAYISIADITKSFAGTAGRIDALQNVNLDVPAGEFLCLVGPSGCGKSTLVFIIAGLVKASSGEVRVGGKPVVEPDPDRTMVFQGDAVFPWMTVAQNIGYGLRYRRHVQERTGQDREPVDPSGWLDWIR